MIRRNEKRAPWQYIAVVPSPIKLADLRLEPAGLGEVLEPVSARLRVALLGLEVDVEQAVALVVAVGPAELVLQRPHEVAGDVHAALDGTVNPSEVLA